MRKLIAGVLTTAFVFTFTPPIQAVSPVTGAKCAKIGATQIFKNKKFTCVKLGKKIVWNTGVPVLKTPTPASSPSPLPIPTESSKPDTSSKPSPTPSAAPSLSQKELDLISFQAVSRDSFDKIRKVWPNSRKYLEIKYHYTDNFPKDILESWKLQVENTVNFYDQLVDSRQIFNVYFITEKDQLWVEGLGFWNPENFTHFQYWNSGLYTNDCEGAAAWFLQAKGASAPELHGGISIASVANLKNMTLWCQHVISHEMFHAVQDYWLTKKQGNLGFSSQDIYDRVEMPIFREGSADTIATAVGEETYEKYFASFKQRFGGMIRGSNLGLKMLSTEAEVVDYLVQSEYRSKFRDAHEASYFLGMILFEYAISTYGFEKYVSLLQSQNKDTEFRLVFKNVYGFEIDEMYRQSASHILKAIRILK